MTQEPKTIISPTSSAKSGTSVLKQQDTAADAQTLESSKIISASIRDGEDVWHIECRTIDGQKYAIVTVDKPFEKLAHEIADFINLKSKLTNGDEWFFDEQTSLSVSRELSKADYQLLSRCFNQNSFIAAGTREDKINDWLKEKIANAE